MVPSSAETDVHRVGDQLLFEIPDTILGREMIVMSRFNRVQEGQTSVGANIEHEAFLGDDTYGPARMLDDTRSMVWRELRSHDATDTTLLSLIFGR